ncbi:MAG: Ig-like domain-containing protein [Prevotella sp.]|nr:Ig-like domain-containing protein [Prevotella sp.]
MKKLLFTLVALLATMTTFAQTNLTSGKTVVPLGGLKSFLPEGVLTVDNLQLITTDGNTTNVFLFPQNADNLEANQALGIQGFYIDLGESKSIGAIQSTWEGADCGANIYVTDTEPAADGSLTGETLIATFTNAQEAKKDAAVAVENSGRYIVFVPTEATNYTWGVKIRTFVALEKQASVLTTLEVSPSMVKVGEATEMTFTAKDQLGLVLTEGITYTATNATLDGTTLTATAVGNVVITATMGETAVTATIKAVNVSAPTANPTEPADLAANVIAVYSAKYNKGINDSNPTWGVGGGAPNPLYTSIEEVVIANDHKVVHVKGAGFNSRTAGGVGISSDYTKIHVALYPFTATTAKIFGDNAYGNALTVEDLVPGQWNYVEIDNTGSQPNYMLVELVGETEFYLDHFYLAKPAADDSEAPTLETAELVSAGIGCATLKLKATDDKSAQVTYVINDGTKDYTTKGDNGTEITYTIGGLAFGQAYTLSIVAQDDNENKSAAQQVGVTTLALAAAPVPTQAAADVISIYSNAYTGTGYAYGGWGQSTVVTDQKAENDDVLQLTNYNYLGFELSTQLDLSNMEYVHIDVLPLQNMSLGITPIMNGGTPTENSTSVGTLVPGQWNSCDIKLSDLALDYANAKAFQLKLDKGTGTEIVYIDNIYFWKSAGGEVPTPEITTITVAAEATSIEADATTQLTVKDQDDNAVAADQVTFSSSDETVATVNENGVVTGVAEGSATITATLKSDNNISSTVEITVTAATPVEHEGTQYTADGKTIYVVANHYTGTDNYEVIITSDDVMNGLGGSFWYINGVGGTRVDANMTISSDGKTLTITATSNPEPELYTPLYVMMPGEVNFGQIVFDWQEIGGSEPTLDTTALETEINAAKALLGSAAIDVDPGKALNDAIANAEQVKQDATTQSDIDQAVTDLKAAEAAYTTATGISRIVLDTGADAIYTIDGRRVENPTRGIYIIDGKKIVIK